MISVALALYIVWIDYHPYGNNYLNILTQETGPMGQTVHNSNINFEHNVSVIF